MALRWPPAWPSVTWPGWFPGGERDDAAAGAGAHVAELLVFQGELVDCADEGRDGGPELAEVLGLAGGRLPGPGEGGARAGTSARSWLSSLFLLAIVCRSLAMAARSRASSPLSPPRSLMRW